MRKLISAAALALFTLQAHAQFSRVVVEGDSLFSVNNGMSNWTQCFTATSIFDNASGGDTLSNIIGEYAVQDHPLAAPRSLFILEGGINDFDNLGATAEVTYSNAMSILEAASTDGFSNWLCTVAPGSPCFGQKESERTNYNHLVRTGLGYGILDIDSLISQDTNDSRYYQSDGIHWTPEYEAWLGSVTIPDAVGLTEPAPVLTISNSPGLITLTWEGRRYSTNRLQSSATPSFSGMTVGSFIVLESEPLTVTLPATNAAIYFRVFSERLDYQTFYSFEH